MMAPNLFDTQSESIIRPLRDRQKMAIEAIRDAVRAGHKRIVLQGPCGFGKTLTAAHLIFEALKKSRRPLFTCPALSLVDQTLKSFQAEGIRDIGIMQANHVLTDHLARVQIASVQTLVRRALPDVDFMILDEIHLQYRGLNAMLDGPWKDKIAIGLSATPWVKGMGLRWTKLIIPATIPELIEEGLLVNTDLYIPEEVADRDNVDMDKGEFTESSASQEMRKHRIVGNVVDTWLNLGRGEKTFMFCVNREHAKAQMAAFVDSGIPFGYVDKDTTLEDRQLAFNQMRHGEIAGIASVGCLVAGVDEDVRCIIDAALTNSEIRLVQKWGRGIRTSPGKTRLIGLDHAGNNSESGLGLFWQIFHDHLDTRHAKEKGSAYEGEKKPAKPRKCGACGLLVPAGRAVCSCGVPLPSRSEVDHAEGELIQYGLTPGTGTKKVKPVENKQEWYSGFLGIARERGHSDGWAAHRYKEKFGVWPRNLNSVAVKPPQAIRSFDHHCRIRFIKGREKDNADG